MKFQSSRRKGFTLVELMVAMAITTMIVTLLVYVTSTAITSWQRSRAEVRAANQGKAMVDSMARDFEAMVARRGNKFEWLNAEANQEQLGPETLASTSAAKLFFFTAVTDRYDGKINTADDRGGDISGVSYRLDYRDPVAKEAGKDDAETFALYRMLVNPDQTFKDLLGKEDLKSAFSSYDSKLLTLENYVCENIYQFSITFNVEVTRKTDKATESVLVPVTLNSDSGSQFVKSFRILGSGIDAPYSGGLATPEELKGGVVRSVSISLTVLSDYAIDQMRTRKFTETQRTKFLNEHSHQFTKLVQIPSA